MTQEEVIALMTSSKNPFEWNQNADTVKAAFGDRYPDYWFASVIQANVAPHIPKGFHIEIGRFTP